MPIDEKYAVGGSIPAPNQPPIAVAHEVMSRATALCDEVRKLADELLGPQPEEVEKPGIPANAGYLNALENAARETQRNIEKARVAIDRIRNRL